MSETPQLVSGSSASNDAGGGAVAGFAAVGGGAGMRGDAGHAGMTGGQAGTAAAPGAATAGAAAGGGGTSISNDAGRPASGPSSMTAGAAASAGAGGEVGATGGAGAGGQVGSASGGPCRAPFGSGLNVAWFKFAGDIPNPDMTRFNQLFQDTHAAGGRVVRWWFHTNGTVTPGYDSSGLANPLTDAEIADLRKLLDAAAAAGVSIVISLWSFDMLQGNQSAPLANNYALLTQDTQRQAYIDRVLTPLVTALKGHKAIYAWEIFNEPEGMTTQNGWTSQTNGRTVDESVIQTCVNWFAAAIHAADPNAWVTNGAWQFAVEANVSSYMNRYSDTELMKAGGRAHGTLDFYEVH
ncbi:MAG TPA: cellulase family glycosylhydrolase, partial [Polyangiales bacterium]